MKREYGIDILKMMAMMMVVAHHVLQSGGVETRLLESSPAYFTQFFHCFCYCAVDCFVLATGYIMSQHTFKYVRIFRLWLKVVGYSLLIVSVVWLFVPTVSVGWRDWMGAVLPVTFNRYWFFTEYVGLFFAIPFLNKLLISLTDRECALMLVSGFGILSVSSLFSGLDLFVTKWGYSFVWFVYLYLLGAFLSTHNIKSKVSSHWLGILLLLGCLVSTLGSIGCRVLPRLVGGGARVGDLAFSYTSPSLVLEAVTLVLLFAKCSVRAVWLQHLIQLTAPSTFIVYVVHSNVVFGAAMGWNRCFLGIADYGDVVTTLSSCFVGVVVFIGVAGFDVLWRLFWQKLDVVKPKISEK